jgi:hypothetical protein
MDKEKLAMVISDMMYQVFGFGPSKSICEPFAEQVLAEAKVVNYLLEMP